MNPNSLNGLNVPYQSNPQNGSNQMNTIPQPKAQKISVLQDMMLKQLESRVDHE